MMRHASDPMEYIQKVSIVNENYFPEATSQFYMKFPWHW